MKFLSKNLLPFFITTVLAMQPQTLMAANRPRDELIKFWVKDAISEDPYMDASGITVEVSDGIVTLSDPDNPSLAFRDIDPYGG